jgi:hypothetical protein
MYIAHLHGRVSFRVLRSEIGTGKRGILADGHLPGQFRIMQTTCIAEGASTVRPTPPFWCLCSIAAVAPSRRSRFLQRY